jgi:hypothetical protein
MLQQVRSSREQGAGSRYSPTSRIARFGTGKGTRREEREMRLSGSIYNRGEQSAVEKSTENTREMERKGWRVCM